MEKGIGGKGQGWDAKPKKWRIFLLGIKHCEMVINLLVMLMATPMAPMIERLVEGIKAVVVWLAFVTMV